MTFTYTRPILKEQLAISKEQIFFVQNNLQLLSDYELLQIFNTIKDKPTLTN